MTVPHSPVVTDLYQLTMMEGYRLASIHAREACFDYFIRHNPFGGGYTVSAGLADALRFLATARFSDADLDYLRSLGLFRDDFVDTLRSWRFGGDVYAVQEGTVVFPREPILRVQGTLEDCQLVETALLNTLNFQSLIATKAARICQEAGVDNVVEFGLRRAQGTDGALSAARAAYIGGCAATSNLLAGEVYGIPVKGTHSHSWVLAFPTELDAFRAFAYAYPKASVLLVDTYDTLGSGMPNAITVGRELAGRGDQLVGVRLDSGDLAYLTVRVRRMLDDAGLTETKIVCSSDLDEHIIRDLRIQGADIDLYGVGTRLVSAHGDSALPGVYKMAAIRGADGDWELKRKLSEGTSKATLPGLKQVWRLYDRDGMAMADWVELIDETPDVSRGILGHHPTDPHARKAYEGVDRALPLLDPVLRDGEPVIEFPPLTAIRARVRDQLEQFDPTHRRILNPHVYKVSLGPKLKAETDRLLEANGAG
jgi:nicotinate phosphoribosyltransferase